LIIIFILNSKYSIFQFFFNNVLCKFIVLIEKVQYYILLKMELTSTEDPLIIKIKGKTIKTNFFMPTFLCQSQMFIFFVNYLSAIQVFSLLKRI
jgi:hypothetical protein